MYVFLSFSLVNHISYLGPNKKEYLFGAISMTNVCPPKT